MKHAAQFFKALANDARLRMLWLLFNHRELCVCDIMAALKIGQSKASRHLNTLRHAGLVTDRKERTWSHYTLCSVGDDLARRHLATLRTTLSARDDAASLLERLHEWLDAKDRDVLCAKDSPCACRSVRAQAEPAGKRRTAMSTRGTPARSRR